MHCQILDLSEQNPLFPFLRDLLPESHHGLHLSCHPSPIRVHESLHESLHEDHHEKALDLWNP